MAAIGLDPDALATVRTELERSRRLLQPIGPSTHERLRRAGWRGPDAERFMREWTSTHRPALERAVRFCSTLADQIGRNIDEQRRASEPSWVPGRLFDTAGPRPLPAAPRDATVYRGRLEGTVLAALVAQGITVTREPLDRGRERVTVTDLRGVGVTGGAAWVARMQFGDHGLAAGASVSASAEMDVATRYRFTGPEGDFPRVLARVLLEKAEEDAPVVGALSEALDEPIAAVVGLLGLDEATRLPEPDSTEHLLGGRVAAAALGGVPGGGAAAAIDGSLLVKVPEHASDPWVAEITASATLVGTVISPLVTDDLPLLSGTSTARLVGHRDPMGNLTGLDVEWTATNGDDARNVRVEVDLRDPGARAVRALVERAFDRFTDGDVDGAVSALDALELNDQWLSYRTTDGDIESFPVSFSVGGSVGGVGLAGSFDGARDEIDWEN